jgi:hypothetical protein
MKTILSLTSIPSRFGTLPSIVRALVEQDVSEIWVNIPFSYKRFPDTEVVVPQELFDIPKVRVNRCEDHGPGTMYLAPALASDADLIVVVNDDTAYPPSLCSELVRAHLEDQSCWCLSGFKVPEYIKGSLNRFHGADVDVTESFGGVILKREWIVRILPEFNDFYALTYNDDIIIGNLFAKHGVRKRFFASPTCHLGLIRQFQFGMGPDALFYNNGEGTHFKNNLRIFKLFKTRDIFYFKDYSN